MKQGFTNRQSKAEQLNSALKNELTKPELTTIRQVYLTEKIQLLEEFIYYSKLKN